MGVDDELAALLRELRQIHDWKAIPTLSGRAKLSYRWVGTALEIRYGKKASIAAVHVDQIQSLLYRRRTLQVHADQASEYTDPKWPQRFNRYKAPYVAAVLATLKDSYGKVL